MFSRLKAIDLLMGEGWRQVWGIQMSVKLKIKQKSEKKNDVFTGKRKIK